MAHAKASKVSALRRKTTPPAYGRKLSARDVRSIVKAMSNRRTSFSCQEEDEAIREMIRARRAVKCPFRREFIELVSDESFQWDFAKFRLSEIDTVITLDMKDRGDGHFEIEADHTFKTSDRSAPVARFLYQAFRSRNEALDAALEHFAFWYGQAIRRRLKPTSTWLVRHRS